jgi:two-component system, cell cycle sensor histidine kinase and response regulator CckA
LQERTVKELEEKYQMFVENSLQGLTIMQDRRFVFCNRKFSELSGYSVQELLDFSPERTIALVHPDDLTNLDEYASGILEGKPILPNLEYRIIKKDGTAAWLEVFSSVIEYNGKPAFQSAFVDINKRKEAEKALLESEKRFKLIAESIDEIFGIWDCEKGIATYISPAFRRIYGLSQDDLQDGQKYIFNYVHPEDQPRAKAFLELMKTGQPLDIEHRIVCADGSVRNLWLRCYPVPDETGLVKQYVGIAQDVTGRRRAEAALLDSKEYLDKIINCLGDPLFVKDEKRKLVLVNEAFRKFSKKPVEELLGKTAFDLLPNEFAVPLWQQEQAILDTGVECFSEDKILVENAGVLTVLTKKTLLRDKNGNKQIVGVMRDITEYKRLETQFQQAQKMEAIGVLAGGVAHDFNNLLSVIKGYTELLMEEFQPDDPKWADLNQIEQAGQRAASLISQLLTFSRKQLLQPEILNLNTIVNDMTKMLRRVIGEYIELSTVTQPDLDPIYADPGQIQQIIMNLAVNARDAMPQGGKLTIETMNVDLDESYVCRHAVMKKGRFAMMAISDNGIGMDAETQSHIFEPFFTTKEKGKGTGLGLSTIYGIVKQSGGFIWVYSEVGKGTTFKIYFPSAKEEDSNSAAEISAIAQGGKETLLIAEDDGSVRSLASRILRGRGYQVLEAANGKDALQIAQAYRDKIHLVLTDIIMPEMGGSALVAQLKVLRPEIKALYFSGYTDGAIVQHGILDSNVEFLQKPFTVENLLRRVREVLAKYD